MKGVVTMEPMDDGVRALARRLRGLRTGHWTNVRITQPMLGQALGGAKGALSVALISSWESDVNPKIPPNARLEGYATLFCTERSLHAGRLRILAEDELTADELIARDRLREELLGLRAAALGQPVREGPPEGLWHFPDGKPIRLICAQLPPKMLRRMPYVDPDDPDYVDLYTFADLDALLELFGHIRAVNPNSEVRIRKAGARPLTADDYTTHLVLLGGVDWNAVTRNVLEQMSLPVEQVSDWDSDKGPYWLAAGEKHYPTLRDGKLQEDVALFYRGVSPFNRKRTVTICNGMYGRGTYGAVRALTDSRFRDRNTAHLRDRFPDEESFGVLTRVAVFEGSTITPDWTEQESLLFEWP